MLFVLGGCGFAQKHPGITVGIVAGTIGFGACEISVEKVKTCGAIGAIAGVALGGITGLVTMFADTSAHELTNDDEGDVIVAPQNADEPPGLPLDAGIMAPVAPVAPVAPIAPVAPTAQPDAGIPVGDAALSYGG
ncbi:MAG TPA: hypothetical protein VFV99_12180 [Kofleriaceae bacterium]|nr:hypothetical protein [Kofleriaceae bacterium]